MSKIGKVDVAILTKNSERLLRECLTSIYENIPVNRLIVVDGYSTDSTLNILEEFQQRHGNIKIIRVGGTRGYARQIAVDHVETEWFMFVDSDVILCKNWFKKAARFIREDVGAVWGMEIWSTLTSNRRLLGFFMKANMKVFNQRGGTHDILIRKKAIEGIRIPSYLHTYEDAYIKDWIFKKGFKVIATFDPYCVHYRPEEVWTLHESIKLAANDLPHAAKRPPLFLAYAFFTAIVARQMLLNRKRNERLKVV
ncbi:glycosyltransferase family 2 protein [Candidatus Bathyarchaeota archaeon]|nr:glycosyltransferase family 2 protein [Candidatus Bathyarchaeota archaeon]